MSRPTLGTTRSGELFIKFAVLLNHSLIHRVLKLRSFSRMESRTPPSSMGEISLAAWKTIIVRPPASFRRQRTLRCRLRNSNLLKENCHGLTQSTNRSSYSPTRASIHSCNLIASRRAILNLAYQQQVFTVSPLHTTTPPPFFFFSLPVS